MLTYLARKSISRSGPRYCARSCSAATRARIPHVSNSGSSAVPRPFYCPARHLAKSARVRQSGGETAVNGIWLKLGSRGSSFTRRSGRSRIASVATQKLAWSGDPMEGFATRKRSSLAQTNTHLDGVRLPTTKRAVPGVSKTPLRTATVSRLFSRVILFRFRRVRKGCF